MFERRLQTVGGRIAAVLPRLDDFVLPELGRLDGGGRVSGQPDSGRGTLGLDFAMIATFAAMIAPQLKALTPVAVAAAAGSVAWMMAQGLPYKLGLMLAALAGVAVGVLLDCYRRRLVLEEGA